MEWVEIVARFIIPAIFAIIAKYLIPTLREWRHYNIAKQGVYAAEQLWRSGQIQKTDRYARAELYIKNKFKISDADAQILIESVVAEMDKVS